MITKEEQFYKKHFNNFFKEGDLNDFDSYKNQRPHHFEKSGRYRICIDSLNKNVNIRKNLIVELGCSTGVTLKFLKNWL